MVRLMSAAAVFGAASILSGGNSTIYTPSPYSTIAPIAASTYSPGGIIPAGQGARDFVVSADGSTFYVVDQQAITSIDRNSGQVIRRYQTKNRLFPTAVPIAVAPDRSRIYVGTCTWGAAALMCRGGNLEVIDAATGASLAVISMGEDEVVAIAAAPNGQTVYVLHLHGFNCCTGTGSPPPSNSFSAIDAATLQVGASLPATAHYLTIGSTPNLIAVTSDSQTAYLWGGNDVDKVDLATFGYSSKVTLETTVACLSLSGDGGTLAVLGIDEPTGELYFIDTATFTPSPAMTIGFYPRNWRSIRRARWSTFRLQRRTAGA